MFAQIEIQLPGHDRTVGWAPVAADGLGSVNTADGQIRVIIDRKIFPVALEDLRQLAKTAPKGAMLTFEPKPDPLYGNPSAQYAKRLTDSLSQEEDRAHGTDLEAKISYKGQAYVQLDRTMLDGTERGGRLWQHLPIVGYRVDEYGDLILIATELKNTNEVSI